MRILVLSQVRVGEVGGNSLGFYGCAFSPDGRSILAHGYQGALQLWSRNEELSVWEPQVTCGGHFASVEGLTWQKDSGDFLLTTSQDQTTRCHGYWNAPETERVRLVRKQSRH